MIKINVDAHIVESMHVSLGVVLKDVNGSVIVMATKRI